MICAVVVVGMSAKQLLGNLCEFWWPYEMRFLQEGNFERVLQIPLFKAKRAFVSWASMGLLLMGLTGSFDYSHAMTADYFLGASLAAFVMSALFFLIWMQGKEGYWRVG